MHKIILAIGWLICCLVVVDTGALAEAAQSPTPSPTTAGVSTAPEGLMSRLFAPGPLIEGHKDLEGSQCLKCHTLSEGVEVSSCLSCHKELLPSVQQKTGFHGRTKKSCIDCHSEHKGRNFDSTQVDSKRFQHQETGFDLDGKHAKIKCQECHLDVRSKKPIRPTDVRYFGQLRDCRSCHKKEDSHSFTRDFAVKDCSDCHGTKTWKEIHDFNHDKQTRFKLVGKHAHLVCLDCHREKDSKIQKYRWNDFEVRLCETCHASPHLQEFSSVLRTTPCQRCHSSESWRVDAQSVTGFKHNLDTQFKLTGKHEFLQCRKCHVPSDLKIVSEKKSIFKFSAKDKAFCSACHLGVHEKQFTKRMKTEDCSQCHSSVNFTERLPFNHQETGFLLSGKHEKVPCEKCHKPTAVAFRPPSTRMMSQFVIPGLRDLNCAACHQDPHTGSFGASCVDCHSDLGWKVTQNFHKNLKLQGVHLVLQCAECHRTERVLRGLSRDCQTCHQKDDVHQGRLPGCADCHGQSFWEAPTYRHSLSRFPLRGIHRTLECSECHAQGIYRGLPSRCVDCHLADAIAVTALRHVMPQMQECNRCHLNQFQFN